MVIITINGKKKEREFQNMAQALAFASQNGECVKAEKVELVYAAKETKKEPTKPASGGGASAGGTGGGTASGSGSGGCE